MLKITRNHLNALLAKTGFALVKNGHINQSLDLRGSDIDPIEAHYLSNGHPFIMDIPIEKCFAIDFSGTNKNNPFVHTLLAYKKGLCKTYSDSPLKDYYDTWQPSNPTKKDERNLELAPPWNYGVRKESNLTASRLNRKDFVKIRKELGLSDKEISGHIGRGPVSKGFGEVTFNRLVKLYDSIEKFGYKPDEMRSGHITASFFIHGNDYRASISSGKHRITALQALGYKKIPIQFGPPKFPVIIRRSEVDKWPNVKAGYYSKLEALRLFDKKFSDEHPSKWTWNQ
jgi:hypothetical protein